MAWDLLDENCSDISDWVDNDTDTGVSEVSPAGQFRFDTNLGAAGDARSGRYRAIGTPPDKFTTEIKTYFDDIGIYANRDDFSLEYSTASWIFRVYFCSDGLFVVKAGGARVEVGTNIVKEGGAAAWQTWRFEVDKSGGEDVATVEVFLDNVSQGTFDCDFVVGYTDGRITITQQGRGTDNMVAHIDFVRVMTVAEENALFFGCNF